jgi:subtilase family serine protease
MNLIYLICIVELYCAQSSKVNGSNRAIIPPFSSFVKFADAFHAAAPNKPATDSRKYSWTKYVRKQEETWMDVQIVTKATDSQIHQVVFAIKQNTAQMENLLNKISNPWNYEMYGHHLSRGRVSDIAIDKTACKALDDFLLQHGVVVVSKTLNNEYVTAEAPISTWENMLDTEFYEINILNRQTGTRLTRALRYTLPKSLHNYVDHIFKVIDLPTTATAMSPARSRMSVHASSPDNFSPNSSTTPQLLNEMYLIRNNTGYWNTTQAIYSSGLQFYSPEDLTTFQNYFSLPQEAIATDVNGHANSNVCSSPALSGSCIEPNTLTQYMTAIAQATPTSFYYWNGTDLWLDWITAVANMTEPPLVISIAYYQFENEISEEYAIAFNNEAIKLSLRGVTLLASSGDDGVAGYAVRSSYPSQYANALFCGYNPYFPATSPYVTAVGGTMVSYLSPLIYTRKCPLYNSAAI